MESLVWSFRTLNGFTLSGPIVQCLFVLLILCWDYIFLVPRYLFRSLFPAQTLGARECPSAVVVIPTLLRQRDELTSLMSTIHSVVNNGYPGDLFVVVSIDGYADAPDLYSELKVWTNQQAWPDRVWLYVTGTPLRRGKPMAIEEGLSFLREMVDRGIHRAFPPVYISTDADADLGVNALERLVMRLTRCNPITGWPARAVAGNLHLRSNFWRGFRHSLTLEGQLQLQIAREYLVANVSRNNLRLIPMCGVPGVLYCTWTDIVLSGPKFLSYARTLRTRDWVKWWLGFKPPGFVGSRAKPVPELLAGDTDDTVSAFLSIIAVRRNGRFTLEPPRTPLHAFWYMLRATFIDRALRYEPEARVFTSSPTTVKGLFKQRRRWNSSRIEVTGRFWPALWFHWSLGLPAIGIVMLMLKYWAFGGVLYLLIPLSVFKTRLLTGFVIGYTAHTVGYTVLTLLSLLLDGKRRDMRLLWALPLSPLYALFFSYLPAVTGGVNDVFLFGNVTGFAPEQTLIRGGSGRLALLFRLRRAFSLALRSVVRGDVPFGAFWFGWRETHWTPNGYEGWTSGKRPRSIVPPVSTWFGRDRKPEDK